MSEHNSKAATSDTVANATATQMQEQFAKIGLVSTVTSGEVIAVEKVESLPITKGENETSPGNVTSINKHVKKLKQAPKPVKVEKHVQQKMAPVEHINPTLNPVINPLIANLLKPHVEISKNYIGAAKVSDIVAENDSIKFINVSFKGKTPIGRFFDFGSNKFNFVFGELGRFKSIQGLAYYLTTGCIDARWRDMNGIECIKHKTMLIKEGNYKVTKVTGLKRIMAEALYVAAKMDKNIFKLIVDNKLPYFSIRKEYGNSEKQNPQRNRIVDDRNYHIKAVMLIDTAIKQMEATKKEVVIDWSKHICFKDD
jgi:hypothetical protein